MDENKRDNKQAWTIVGFIVLIAVLTAAVQLIFKGLSYVVPQPAASVGTVEAADQGAPGVDAEAPSFCPHCGSRLREGFQWGQYCPYCGNLVE